jgi:hypothetical protein
MSLTSPAASGAMIRCIDTSANDDRLIVF